MKIEILSIAKPARNSLENQLILDYDKRLPWQLSYKELWCKKQLPAAKRKEAESTLLLEALAPKTTLIVLDEKGKHFTSGNFSKKLTSYQGQGNNHLSFCIGGAYGHSDTLKNRADLLLSLSPMTMPHLIARLILVEQIYRAYTLQEGHPYHKE